MKILDKHTLNSATLASFLQPLAIALFCILLGIACRSPIANSQNSPPPAPAVHTCRSQIAPYSEKPAFEIEFDFIDSQFQHLPVVTKRQRSHQTTEEIIVWDALYGTDGDYDYWTTPILREFTIEKNQPLVITRMSSLPRYANTVAKLNATLAVDFRRKTFPVSCTASSQTSIIKIAQVHTCRAKVSPGKLPLFDVEFDYLTEGSLQKRYGYSEQNIYVKATALFESSKGQVRYLEALVGSDGDYTFWTTPVLRDVGGGTSPLVIDMEPGIIVRPGSPSLTTQLNSALSLGLAGKSYPVKCS